MNDRPAAQFAAELEAELDSYPDQRGEILLEAAHQWRLAGDDDRAITLWIQAIDSGGEDGALARVSLAEVLFDRGRVDEAWAQLDALRRVRVASPAPYHMAAELLEERGAVEQALTWFNIAASRLSDQEMADHGAELGALSYANHILAGRQRVRQALGLPADELDDSVQSAAERADEVFSAATPSRRPRQARVLFWPRGEFPRAQAIWPQLVLANDTDTFFTEREKSNRELVDSGIPRVTMVPITVEKLIDYTARTGADPTDSDTRLSCIDEIVAEGTAIDWPPSRNAPCWCGSSVKYKKCCGRPTSG